MKKNFKKIHWLKLLFIFLFIVCYFLLTLSNKVSAIKPKFLPMLLTKDSIDTLKKHGVDNLIFQCRNKKANSNREVYELILYAYKADGTLISKIKLDKINCPGNTCLFNKDISIGNLYLSRVDLDYLTSNNDYAYLRFDPLSSASDPSLSEYISYDVYPVNISFEKLLPPPTPIRRLDPSPPAKR